MEYQSNLDDVMDNLVLKLESIKETSPVLRLIAISLATSNNGRIHNEGKNVRETQIGKYSTKPTLIGAKSFRKKSTANKIFGSKKKRSELKWRKVKGKSLAILPGGYKQIRALDGDKTSFVNLSRTGKLSKEFQAAKIPGGWGVGFTTSYGGDLRKYLEQKYGQVWGITSSDKKAIDITLGKEIKKKFKSREGGLI